MAWLQLILAGIFEIVWAISIKYTEGFTKLYASILMLIAAIVSFYFLSEALKSIPVGTAYTIFTGIGTIGTVVFGILYFNESKDLYRIVCILLVCAGIIGLKFVGE